MIDDNLNHHVFVSLKSRDLWNINSRLDEIADIRDWILELVEWNKDKFYIRYLSATERLDIWFEEERHAVACALRWS